MLNWKGYEDRRFAFLRERDGLPAAVEWMRQSIRIYRKAVLDRRFYSPNHRLGFMKSYLDSRRLVRENDLDTKSLKA